MKCLFVMPALRFGGAERVTSVLANEWVKQGVNVRILLVETDETNCYPLADNVELKSCRRETQIGQVKQGAIIRAIRKQIKEKLIRFIRKLLNIVQQSLFSRLLAHKNVTPKKCKTVVR